MIRYLSVCSGIEAATVAWHPLGWQPVAFAEVDAYPSAVLAHHYPHVPNYGDMTRFREWPDAALDLLVGGTPCQSFSVAGLRKGLDDPRGSLMLVYLALARRARPRWVVWENVPGVLSADDGRAFGSLLGGLAELGYGFAYRVLDAQHFGVAQRRKRVFVVGCLGDWRRAAAVLFERESLSGHPAPSRTTGQVAPTVPARRAAGGGFGTDFDCDGGLIPQTRMGKGINTTCDEGQTLIPGQIGGAFDGPTHSLRADGFDAGEDGTGRGTPLVSVVRTQEPIYFQDDATPKYGSTVGALRRDAGGFGACVAHAFDARQSDVIQYGDQAGPLDTHGHSIAIAFSAKDHGADAGDIAPTLRAGGHTSSHANGGVMPAVAYRVHGENSGAMQGAGAANVADPVEVARALDTQGGYAANQGGNVVLGPAVPEPSMAVRRLTPRECERLQGFPDDYTLIPYRGKPAADGPRYKALGNSMAVPVMRWIGERIQMVDSLDSQDPAQER